MLNLTDPITAVPLVGQAVASRLTKLNILSVADLLHHYPARHIDRATTSTISELKAGQPATITAQVIKFTNIYTQTGKNLQQARVADQTGQLDITWFNQSYLSQTLKVGETFAFSGKPRLYRNRLTLTAPEFEKVNQEVSNFEFRASNLHVGRLVPIYPETEGISSKRLRSLISRALKVTHIPDYLPSSITTQHSLKSLSLSLSQIHFPDNKDSLKSARHRLAFDELFFLQLQGAHRRALWDRQTTHYRIKPNLKLTTSFIKSLPFKLTSAQQRAVKEILADLSKQRPMNRLLEGDVGSGKTVVAAVAIAAVHRAGLKSLLMAPTEILANQHYQELTKLLDITGLKIGLQTGTTKHSGDFDLVVGTQSLLFSDQSNTQIGLIIVDEQHRFGVNQRAKLESISGNPHRLTMSATPIPRTVALTLYGDLDVSIIDQMPEKRLPVKTWVVPHAKRKKGYQWIQDQVIKHNAQVFVVCPLIDPSTSLKLSGVKSVNQEYQALKKVFPRLKLSLLHGKIASKNKDQILADFKARQSHILVTTPVIEVGIDIPSATIIVIEAAERFGLAALHQLRGRVGRGDRQSYCLLFSSTDAKSDNARLTSLTKYNSGFKLAQIDLRLRGPGEVFGLSQHGFTGLKLARLTDANLLKSTKQAALSLLQSDPGLTRHSALKAKLDLTSDRLVTSN